MSLLTDKEIEQRNINENALIKWCKKRGINEYVRCPINDDTDDTYCRDISEAIRAFNKYMNDD